MMLRKIAGIRSEDNGDGALRTMIRHAEFFLQCGHVTLEEYRDLDRLERAAMVAASEAIEAKKAVQIGLSGTSPINAAKVYSDYDGGDWLIRILLQQSCERMSSRITKESRNEPLAVL